MSDSQYHFSLTTLDLMTGGESGYDVVSPPDGNKNRRKQKTSVYWQDTNLLRQQRQTAIATTQDMERNFATVAWAIRKHLDYVSALTFKPIGGTRQWRLQLLNWYRNWSRRTNCDVRRRHSMRRQIRLSEQRRVVDGDFGVAKIGGVGRNRGRLDPIEGYRIADPFQNMARRTINELKLDPERWINGVEIDKNGAARRYAVFSRNVDGNAEFDRFIRADQMCMVGYYSRFDQVRGVSPLLSGIQSFIDCSDNITLAQAKMRIASLFGLSMYRDAPVSEDQYDGPVPTTDEDGDGEADAGYEFDFSGGPQFLDLQPGDRAEFLESKTPPAEVVEFLRFLMNLALKTLDLPDSFLREGETNFFGSRAALQLYLRACVDKQADLMEFLDEVLRWRIGMAIRDGDLLPPRGMQFDDIQWKWIPSGFPWAWDPLKEAKGAKESIELGADNIERVAALNGTDVEENLEINKRIFDQWAEMEIKLPWQSVPDAVDDPSLLVGDKDE